MPCQLRVSDTTSKPPVASLAMRTAASLASPPVLRNIERSSPAGISAATRSASASTGSDSMPELRWTAAPRARWTASTMRGWLWPIVAQIWPEVKSRTRRPSTVSSHDPDARAITSWENSPL